MFKNKLLRFASQPDDYQSELAVINKLKPKSALLWACGGDNFLNLKVTSKDMQIDVFDADVIEIEHLKSKISCLKRNDLEHMNYQHNDQSGLNQSGSYESLLRIVRRYFFEFVAEHETFDGRFWQLPEEERKETLKSMFSIPAWERAFAMFFSKPSLEALIGGNWPEDSCRHVKENIENLLLRDDCATNPFLKHLFQGEYDESAKPEYFDSLKKLNFEESKFLTDHIWNIDISTYDFLSLGSYFDFLSQEERLKAIAYLKEKLQKSSVLVIRSLRENSSFLNDLEPEFFIDKAWGSELLRKDRSFLFSHMLIAIKE